eukprot:6840433-Pyramimonas_sp.AAC.1
MAQLGCRDIPCEFNKILGVSLAETIRQRCTITPTTDEWTIEDSYAAFYAPWDPYCGFKRSADCLDHDHLMSRSRAYHKRAQATAVTSTA